MTLRFLIFWLLSCSVETGLLRADEFDFDDEPESPSPKTSSKLMASEEFKIDFPLRGTFGLNLGRQTGKPIRWMAQSADVNLILDWRIPRGRIYGEASGSWNHAWDTEDDPQTLKDHYTKDGLVRELWWSGSNRWATLYLGRQIVVLGKGDFLSVLDLVSPADQTMLFFADPEDARLGQNLVRLNIYPTEGQQLTLMHSPSARSGRYPGHGHPYQQFPDYQRDDPKHLKEHVLLYQYNSDRLGVSLSGGRVHQRSPVLKADLSNGTFAGSHEPFSFYGLGASWAMTGWLLKAELAQYQNYAYQKGPGFETRNVQAGMIGFDYLHDRLGSLTVEANVIRPVNRNESDDDTSLYSASWTDTWLRDDLSLSLVHMGFKRFRNQLNRLHLSYRMNDDWTIESQYTHISIKDNEFKAFEHVDRMDIKIKYGFSLSEL